MPSPLIFHETDGRQDTALRCANFTQAIEDDASLTTRFYNDEWTDRKRLKCRNVSVKVLILVSFRSFNAPVTDATCTYG